jgi:hypothetical protein
MKTMLWKEFRENFKWAVLAMLGLGMAEFYALNQQQFFGLYVMDSAPLCKSSFLMITTFGCAAVGLVLGLVQLLPEQRRDQWASLIHRPVPRDTIFFGKALAGFLLYLLATVVPFLAVVWYVATPNHFPFPFTAGMVYPGVADIFAGAIYYFAALFVALRHGHWFGTRTLGFLAAVGGSFFITGYDIPFRVAIEVALLGWAMLIAASWGTMRTNGSFREQPWLARLALLAVVFYGVCAAGDITSMILNVFTRPEIYFGSEYCVDLDGRPLLKATTKSGRETFTDLQGNPVTDSRLTGSASYRNLLYFTRLSNRIGDAHGTGTDTYNFGYRSGETYLYATIERGSGTGNAWYYVPADRLFSGYNIYGRNQLGSIGQDGFVPGNQPAAPFREALETNEPYQIPNFVRFGQTAYYIDFEGHTMTSIFSEPGAEIFGLGSFNSYLDDPSIRDLAGMALLKELRVVDKTGKTVASLPYDQDVDRWGSLSTAIKPTKDRFFIKYDPSGWVESAGEEHLPSYLEEFDLQGHVLNSYTLPPVPEPFEPSSWEYYIGESLHSPVFYFGEMLYQKLGADLGSGRLAEIVHRRFDLRWNLTKETIIRVLIVSLASAVVTLFWARSAQFSSRRAWTWTAFAFATNIAGLITFRLVADWPVLVPCPSCQRKRSIHETLCPHCHAPWVVPGRDGTEIFEETPTAVTTSV